MENNIEKTQANVEKPYNLEANIEAMLCYLPFVGLFTSLAIFLIEKDNKFVKFHALQGLLLAAVHSLIMFAMYLTFFLLVLSPIINIAAAIIWGYMMWNAYNNLEVELPIIGKIARDQIK